MSIIDAIMGKNMAIDELTKSGGVGYTEKSVFTFDGNTEGKLKYSGMPLYKISDKTPDFSTFSKIVGIMGGVELEAFAGDVVIENGELGATLSINVSGRAVVLAMVYHDGSEENTGLYLFSYGGEYISCIEFEDAVHTIDPKYMTQVIDLDEMGITDTIISLFGQGGGIATVDTTATLEGFDASYPTVVRLTFSHLLIETTNVTFVYKVESGKVFSVCFEVPFDLDKLGRLTVLMACDEDIGFKVNVAVSEL